MPTETHPEGPARGRGLVARTDSLFATVQGHEEHADRDRNGTHRKRVDGCHERGGRLTMRARTVNNGTGRPSRSARHRRRSGSRALPQAGGRPRPRIRVRGRPARATREADRACPSGRDGRAHRVEGFAADPRSRVSERRTRKWHRPTPELEPGPAPPREPMPPLVETLAAPPTPPQSASAASSVVPPPPVSERQLEDFKASFGAPPSTPRVVPRADDRTLLLALATHVDIADEISTVAAFDAEVEQLARAAAEDRMKRWREMTREGQVRWLSLLVAWAKALERDAFHLHQSTLTIASVFRGLRSFSINDNPGFVHGFARTASPKSATWRADAVRLFREIRPEAVHAPAKPKTAPKETKSAADDDGAEPQLLADWPYVDRVRGLRVALLGGEVREERRVALEQAFQFASLEWIPRDRPRLLASLAERASRGSLDFILVTKFVAHAETSALERSTRAPLLVMRHGYGVTTVRQVFEEYFARAEGKVGAKGAGRSR